MVDVVDVVEVEVVEVDVVDVEEVGVEVVDDDGEVEMVETVEWAAVVELDDVVVAGAAPQAVLVGAADVVDVEEDEVDVGDVVDVDDVVVVVSA